MLAANTYDLLISDIGMPEMDGYELIRKIRMQPGLEKLKAIALSGYGRQVDTVRALQSGFEGYVPKTRVVLFEAGVAAANGLSKRDALATITIDAAKILGLDSRIGSLVKDKDADIALFDGDPFEYTTHCTGTIINGQVVSVIVR